jgi:pseudouridine-5'-phosphate glycosidase
VIVVAPEVEAALRDGEPVVALETTLVAHGFPPGQGVEVGAESERRVREAGAVPATIGVLDGSIRIGLAPDELERATDRFWRSPRQSNVEGSGLGLAIASELAERMEGRLLADSAPGQTTFTLELPA